MTTGHLVEVAGGCFCLFMAVRNIVIYCIFHEEKKGEIIAVYVSFPLIQCYDLLYKERDVECKLLSTSYLFLKAFKKL